MSEFEKIFYFDVNGIPNINVAISNLDSKEFNLANTIRRDPMASQIIKDVTYDMINISDDFTEIAAEIVSRMDMYIDRKHPHWAKDWDNIVSQTGYDESESRWNWCGAGSDASNVEKVACVVLIAILIFAML